MTLYRYEEPTPDTGGYCCGECGREGRYVSVTIDQLTGVFRREMYVTICKNHSGGPASPHVRECFKEVATSGIGDTPVDSAMVGGGR